jgi:hypothetical protein
MVMAERFGGRLRAFLSAAAIAGALCLPGCAQAPTVAASAIPPVPPGQARLWFYRDFEPSVSLGMANVSLNGVNGIHVYPDGSASYRDVPPGHYHVTVESYGVDVNQSRDLDLAAGQEAYVKVLSLPLIEEGDLSSFSRDTFYASLVPPDEARAIVAGRPFAGGM